MTHTFNPFRCLPRWFVVPCVIFVVGGFVLGRWFNSRPVITIKATRLGEVVQAEVYSEGQSVGQTPYVYRGKSGEVLRLTVKHETLEQSLELTLKRGRQEKLVEFHPMRLEFRAYDTMGRAVPRAFMQTPDRPDEWAPMTEGPAKLTKDVGTALEVTFKSNSGEYKKQSLNTESVTWQDKQTYDAWLEAGLKDRLDELDQYYANWDGIIQRLRSESSDAAHEYPLIFVAPEHWHGKPDGGNGGGKPGGDGGGKPGGDGGGKPGGGDGGGKPEDKAYWGTWEGHPSGPGSTTDPTGKYWATDIKLKKEDVQGKTPQQRATMRNEIFWRQGFAFQKKYWPKYFQGAGIPRSPTERALKGYEEANSLTIQGVEEAEGNKWAPPD